MSDRLSRYFTEYSRFHTTPGNKICHYFGIPMIALSLLGLLAAIPIGSWGVGAILRFDAGVLLWIIAVLFYLTLDWKLAIPFGLVAAGLYFLGRATPLAWLWAIFILGWIFQGIGHYRYEKKSPAFFKNLEHILIGPLWIFARMIGYRVERG